MAAGARADVAGALGQARAEARAAERLEGQAQDQAATSNLPVAGLVVALVAAEGQAKAGATMAVTEQRALRAPMAAW